MVARKPIPAQSPVYGGYQQPQVEDDPRSSWERSSDDEEEWDAPAKPPAANAKGPVPYPSEATRDDDRYDGDRHQTMPASPMPRDTYDHGGKQEASGGPKLGEIPDFMRPGGNHRKETNPFLRKKVPNNPNLQPPTEQMSALSVQNTGASAWDGNVVDSPQALHPPGNPWAQSTSSQNPSPSPSPRPPGETQWTPAQSGPYAQPAPAVTQGTPWDSTSKQPPLQVPINTGGEQWTEQVSHHFQPSPVRLQHEEDPWAEKPEQPAAPPPPVPAYQVDKDPWAPEHANTTIHAPVPSPKPSPSPAIMSLTSDDESVWDDARASNGKGPERPAAAPTNNNNKPESSSNIWDDLGALDKGKEKASEPPVSSSQQLDDWNLIDAGDSSMPTVAPPIEPQEQEKPSLPPRNNGESSRWVSPRPAVDAKAETYQIKNVKWQDATALADQNPRISPILVQNENGPCPMVALVNALCLTTPPDVTDSSLVEVLRSREQISLNLLLDAVFEELMSPRRLNPDGLLPDIGDLYAFLQSLHTGMNVNPRFIPSQEIVAAFEHTSLTHLHPAERSQYIPGTFENTQEMSLYATFQIPLIHGWLPGEEDHASEALERQATSYEDAQNLLFREEELDDKLSGNGLTPDEQQLYQDIMTIKAFLETSATQLTPWGIQVIAKAMRPGTFAILFRNDHFSTLYCHPHTKQLVTLVTDEGYRTHDEVVWESLVDIRGERTQFLAGDFKVVTSAEGSSNRDMNDEHAGQWTTVQNRRGKGREEDQPAAAGPSQEQEDQDLALALQLQEEEDERHRESEARQRRENNMSAQVMEPQGRNQYSQPVIRPSRSSAGNSIAPARRSSSSLTPSGPAPAQPPRPAQSHVVRPLIPPRRNVPPSQIPNAGEAPPPPPYEQASQDPLYEPPLGHPNHPTSTGVSRQSTNASFATAPSGVRPTGQSAAGMRPGHHGREHGKERDRDCVVM